MFLNVPSLGSPVTRRDFVSRVAWPPHRESRFTRGRDTGRIGRYDYACPISFPEPAGRRPKDATDGKHFPNLDRKGEFPSRPTVRGRGLAGRRDADDYPLESDAWTPTRAHGLRPTAATGVSKHLGGYRSEPRSVVSGLEACRSVSHRFLRPHSKGTTSSSADRQH